jgi:hypothetical protein
MGQVTINGVVHTVDDGVQKYIQDCERDVQNSLAEAEGAKATINSLRVKVEQALAAGEMKVKAAESKLMGWVEARAHSFFLAADGDFHQVSSLLKHVAAGLDPHMQPATIGGSALPTTVPPFAAAGTVTAPVQPAAASAPAASVSAPAPAAPAPAASVAATATAPAQGS